MKLQAQGLTSGYGSSVICQQVDLEVATGEVVCVLGRNGVGKTTLMRTLIGILPCRAGRIAFDGDDITTMSSSGRARKGLAYVPQGRMVFPDISVAENLRSGTLIGRSGGFAEPAELIFEYFPILKDRLAQMAGTLSGGQQQMLAIGRALAGAPRMLLLDEPSEGIQPSIVQEIREIIIKIATQQNIGVLLVEQNLKFATGASSRGYVMDKGAIVAAGEMQQLLNEPAVAEHLTFVE